MIQSVIQYCPALQEFHAELDKAKSKGLLDHHLINFFNEVDMNNSAPGVIAKVEGIIQLGKTEASKIEELFHYLSSKYAGYIHDIRCESPSFIDSSYLGQNVRFPAQSYYSFHYIWMFRY